MNQVAKEITKLTTETRNSKTLNIDQESTAGILKMINQEDRLVAERVGEVIPVISQAVDMIVERMQKGGRLIYVGAGTSGRLGILDAVECPPTFGVDSNQIMGILAGGANAFIQAKEGAEDQEIEAFTDLEKANLTDLDVVFAIAASGRTPYAIGAIKKGKEVGAGTIALTCNQEASMNELADVAIVPVVGPEVITGSTRMKAGTAQKLVLNMISTTTMIKMGKVYSNLMVGVKVSNQKLAERGKWIIMTATGCDYEVADQALVSAANDVKTAIVMIKCGVDVAEAKGLLKKSQGIVHLALKEGLNCGE
ncbi:MAG: N-acetylmuramic acid 6-phosphate etherase [Halanaerobiales bacterium]|nr:N-acetylmuramic acid 6-phosphate etherase [Halanaerobiales bacterium]